MLLLVFLFGFTDLENIILPFVTVCHHGVTDRLSPSKMTSRLKRKLGELGVDTSSRRANENFCLVSTTPPTHSQPIIH